MKIQTYVKITILDGDEKGKVCTFSESGETNTEYTEDGIIESIGFGWSYIHPVYVDDKRGISMEDFEEAMKVLQKEDV